MEPCLGHVAAGAGFVEHRIHETASAGPKDEVTEAS